jgi:hypothetical protein
MSRVRTGNAPDAWREEPPSRARAHSFSSAWSEGGYAVDRAEVAVSADEKRLLPRRDKAAKA